MQFQSILVIVTLMYLGYVAARISKELRITLPNGSKLLGRGLRSHDGRSIRAFIGIPYAKPPVGELRFKPPEPIDAWDGEYQATHARSMCLQKDPFARQDNIQGSEDCLFLNVYTPHLTNASEVGLPVMVFVHGGGLVCGDGKRHGSEYLLDHDIVYVSFNYRLGPLGFLSSGQEDCTGNFGLKDQVLALKWVQENIKAFGGDPKSVTIFGESAGGASVTYLMMSPLTKGLFSRAIPQSGTNLASWAQPAHEGIAPKRAKKLAESLDCYTPHDWAKTINCLRKVSAESITEAFYDFYEWDKDPMVPFPPVVEPDLPGAFITKHPRGQPDEQSLSIPMMTGLTYDEGVMKSAALLHVPGLFEDFSKNVKSILPITLNYDHHDKSTQNHITTQILDFYFNNAAPSREKYENVTSLFGDAWFLEAMDSYLQARLSQKNAAPTFVYLFTHKGAASFSEVFSGDSESYYGVSHVEELPYLFPMGERLFISALPSEADIEMRKTIIKLWVNFATTGNPTPETRVLPEWIPAKEFPLKYYRIGNLHYENKPMFGIEHDGIFENRARFWREIGAHSPSQINMKEEL